MPNLSVTIKQNESRATYGDIWLVRPKKEEIIIRTNDNLNREEAGSSKKRGTVISSNDRTNREEAGSSRWNDTIISSNNSINREETVKDQNSLTSQVGLFV